MDWLFALGWGGGMMPQNLKRKLKKIIIIVNDFHYSRKIKPIILKRG